MTHRNSIRLLTGALVATVLSAFFATVQAQTVQEGSVEFGQQVLAGQRTSSKFEEYRSIPSGSILNRLSLRLNNQEGRRYVSVEAFHVGLADQSIALNAGYTQKLHLSVGYDQTPHLLSLNGRSIFTSPSAGTYRLPRQTRLDLNKLLTTDSNPNVTGLQPDLTAIAALVNGTSRGVELRNSRKKTSVALRYTPLREQNKQWNVSLQYSNEDRNGTKPMGATFQFSSINELPQPIAYRTQEFKAGTEFSSSRWSAALNYTLSDFKNEINTLVWDNPFIVTDANTKPSQGRLALFPDNSANSVAFSGAVNLPGATRIAASVSYTGRRQNDRFLDYTINTALQALPTYPALPDTNLKGAVNILTTNVVLTSRPFRQLSFNAQYRVYDMKNESKSLVFPKYVGYGDYQLSADARQNLPIAHKRQNAGFDANWQIIPGATFKMGYGYERWDREFRDAPKTTENTVLTSLNLIPYDWLTVRSSYTRSWRKTHDYDFELHVGEETFPSGEAGLFGLDPVLPELRRFDMAGRIRDRVSTTAQLTPLEAVSFTASIGYFNDDFNKSHYGLLYHKGTDASVGVDCYLISRLTLFADYTWEDFKFRQKSRQRSPGTASLPPNDSPDNDWQSDQHDLAHTFNSGVNGTLIPRKLDASVDYVYSRANGKVTTAKLGTGPLLTTVENYPGTKFRMHQFGTSLQYRLSNRVVPRAEYRYERYQESYFSQAKLDTYMGTVDASTSSSTFLGATQPGYTAHIFGVFVSFLF